MHPNGAKKNKLAQAIFSKDGPYLSNLDVTSKPKVIPKYKPINKNIKGIPKKQTLRIKELLSELQEPNLLKFLLLKVRAAIISLILIGAMNKFVKFLPKFPQETSC